MTILLPKGIYFLFVYEFIYTFISACVHSFKCTCVIFAPSEQTLLSHNINLQATVSCITMVLVGNSLLLFAGVLCYCGNKNTKCRKKNVSY